MSTDARQATERLAESIGKKETFPPWLVALIQDKNNPAAMVQMQTAYAQLFEAMSSNTLATMRYIGEQMNSQSPGTGDMVLKMLEKVVDTGAAMLAGGGGEDEKPAETAKAQDGAPAKQLAGASNGTSGGAATKPAETKPAAAPSPAEGLGTMAPFVEKLRLAVEKNVPPEEVASKAIDMVDFAVSFGDPEAERLLKIAETDLPRFVAILLPKAPDDYRAKVQAAIQKQSDEARTKAEAEAKPEPQVAQA